MCKMKTLKKIALMCLALVLVQTVKAQKTEWKELKDFHEVMSKTFHPSEEGNFKPLKEHSGELVAGVKAWQASAVPQGFKADETKKVLAALLLKCEEINKAVADKKSDKDLKVLITEAHDIFHQIVEKCRKPEGEK